MCVPQNSKIPVSIQHLEPMSPEGGGEVELRIWKGWGCSSEILNWTPKGDRSGRGPSFFWPLKETKKIYISNIYFYIFSRATLNETFTAKLMACCPEHPKWYQNPKFTPLSETTSIATPFICRVPPGPMSLCNGLLTTLFHCFCLYLSILISNHHETATKTSKENWSHEQSNNTARALHCLVQILLSKVHKVM